MTPPPAVMPFRNDCAVLIRAGRAAGRPRAGHGRPRRV